MKGLATVGTACHNILSNQTGKPILKAMAETLKTVGNCELKVLQTYYQLLITTPIITRNTHKYLISYQANNISFENS